MVFVWLGESVLIDGVIVWGLIMLNEVVINGELVLVMKIVGVDVFGGMVNVSSVIMVKVM